MNDRTPFRLQDIISAIDQIMDLLRDKNYDDLASDKVARAAFERFLERLSEASRHIPDAMKITRPDIPWRRVADIGNLIRHAYDRVDSKILWEIYSKGELSQLREACADFLAEKS